MKTIFFDIEFTDLADDAKLISIGLVDVTGQKTFYAELTDTWQPQDASVFVRQNVLPHLQGGDARMTWAELVERLTAWLQDFGEPVRLATDSLTWDWPWIQRILRQAPNLACEPLVLSMNNLTHILLFEQARDAAFANGLRKHHALDDAEANRRGYVAAGEYNWKEPKQ